MVGFAWIRRVETNYHHSFLYFVFPVRSWVQRMRISLTENLSVEYLQTEKIVHALTQFSRSSRYIPAIIYILHIETVRNQMISSIFLNVTKNNFLCWLVDWLINSWIDWLIDRLICLPRITGWEGEVVPTLRSLSKQSIYQEDSYCPKPVNTKYVLSRLVSKVRRTLDSQLLPAIQENNLQTSPIFA